jgi:hypothetical protein
MALGVPTRGSGIAKPSESGMQKFIPRRSAPARALPVEGPAKDQVCRAVLVGGQAPQPMVNQHRLANTGPGHDANHVDLPGPATDQGPGIGPSRARTPSPPRAQRPLRPPRATGPPRFAPVPVTPATPELRLTNREKNFYVSSMRDCTPASMALSNRPHVPRNSATRHSPTPL